MKYTKPILLLCASLALAGCGGSGGSGSSGSAQSFGVFATDSFNDDYDQVWVTLYKVELISASGASTTVFNDPNGHAVDVKRLRDSSGARFLFLDDAFTGSTTYTQVRVTIGPNLVLFPKGSQTGQQVPVSGTTTDSQGNPVLTFPLASPRNLASGGDDLIIDFDLAHFVVANGKVTLALQEGQKTGLHDPNRHEQALWKGAVSGLSGTPPAFTFTLTKADGTAVTVVTDANTRFANSDEGAHGVLTNNQQVMVLGTFDATANHLVAKGIKIREAEESDNHPVVQGVASAVDATAGTFTLTLSLVDGFVPMHTTVTVATSSTTVFRGPHGATLTAADFFTQLATAQHVDVAGTYDATSNTITAAGLRLND